MLVSQLHGRAQAQGGQALCPAQTADLALAHGLGHRRIQPVMRVLLPLLARQLPSFVIC